MNEFCPCVCAFSRNNDHRILSIHYTNHFVPTGWVLQYASLHQEDTNRILYLTGCCLSCRDERIRSGVRIPPHYTGDALLEYIYQKMFQYRPFDLRFSDGTYRGALPARSHWYMEQDDLTRTLRNAQFLTLFRKEDQCYVGDWLNRCHSEDEYIAPHRDRLSTLFFSVLEQAKAAGELQEIAPIIHYCLPNKEKPIPSEDDYYLTNHSFSPEATLFHNSEGIIVSLSIVGTCNHTGEKGCVIGSLKTFNDDADAFRLMGQLCGILVCNMVKYIHDNVHRYTPRRKLKAKLQNEKQPYHPD